MCVVVLTMILIIVCLMFFVTGLQAGGWDNLHEHEDFVAAKAPFFELACMRVGGTCAKSNSCPPGTKVAQTGLCPEQQRYGMECCRPPLETTYFEQPCMRVGGFCADVCPPKTRVAEMGLCPDQQIYGVECCISKTQDLGARFFELPCMRLGGTCARRYACPPGTKFMQRGLCPQQQRLGMDCCKPYIAKKKCSAKKGFCAPKKHTCPTKITNNIIDCLPTEICCIGH